MLEQRGSGNATYRVRVAAGGSCWKAGLRSDRSRAGLPARLDGCVRRWPWRLFGYV